MRESIVEVLFVPIKKLWSHWVLVFSVNIALKLQFFLQELQFKYFLSLFLLKNIFNVLEVLMISIYQQCFIGKFKIIIIHYGFLNFKWNMSFYYHYFSGFNHFDFAFLAVIIEIY